MPERRLVLTRVPRPVVVALLASIVSLIGHLLGVGELAGEDVAPIVDRGLDLVVVLAAGFGWSSLSRGLARGADEGAQE